MRLKRFFEEHFFIIVITLVALIARLVRYRYYPPMWDDSVYVLMGKYLFSGGQSGLMEPFRPLLWPLSLGALWKAGADLILWGRVLQLVFSLGNVILVYIVGRKVFEQKTAVLAALFLALSPTCFFWGSSLYPELMASCLGLLSVYLFVRERYFFCGLLGLAAVNAKLTQAVVCGLLGIAVLFFPSPSRGFSKRAKWVAGALCGAALFLFLNHAVYGNIFYPFTQAKIVYTQMDFSWGRGILFCLKRLFALEGIIFIFVPLALFGVWRERFKGPGTLLFIIGLATFLWTGKLLTDIPRFFITSLPYLYLLASAGFGEAWHFAQKKNAVYRGLIIGFAAAATLLQLRQIATMRFPPEELDVFQQYLAHGDRGRGGRIWISSPMALVYTDLKADELMYYPVLDLKKISELNARLAQADIILWDDRALPCRPAGDAACQEAKKAFYGRLIQKFRRAYDQDLGPAGHISIFQNPF